MESVTLTFQHSQIKKKKALGTSSALGTQRGARQIGAVVEGSVLHPERNKTNSNKIETPFCISSNPSWPALQIQLVLRQSRDAKRNGYIEELL